ncbi:hypothetical protein JM84_1680 [Dokdonia sp. Hel_I_63]|nr:hypothetical protein JM84_1680 [Dokdonia sp. Hel_I_63]
MKNNWHCELCNHQRKNLREGSICNLTKRKPDFNRTCSKKLFSTKFKNRLREVNILFEYAKIERKSKFKSVFVFGLLGLFLIGVGVYFLYYMYTILESMKSPGYYIIFKLYGLPFFIFIFAYKFLSDSVKIYSYHVLKLREAKLKKDRIDAVLELYHITYDLEIDLHPNYRSPQDAKVNLEVHNLR